MKWFTLIYTSFGEKSSIIVGSSCLIIDEMGLRKRGVQYQTETESQGLNLSASPYAGVVYVNCQVNHGQSGTYVCCTMAHVASQNSCSTNLIG